MLRRKEVQELLHPDEKIMSLTVFPRYGYVLCLQLLRFVVNGLQLKSMKQIACVYVSEISQMCSSVNLVCCSVNN